MMGIFCRALTERARGLQNFWMDLRTLVTASIGKIHGKARIIAISAALAAVAFACLVHANARVDEVVNQKRSLTKASLAEVLRGSASFYEFPDDVEIPAELVKNTFGHADQKIHAKVSYAFDPKLQAQMETLFRQYRPDYGAFVAMDAKTGRVLSMVSFKGSERQSRASAPPQSANLALQATFPSASVFKVVTAAAAIETQRYSADTVIPWNGRGHTLYRNQVLSNRQSRWTRYTSLKEAFAKSVNAVFGKIGAYSVGPAELREYADRFGFDRPVAADVPVQEGHAPIKDDPWDLAETASGFTKDNTMSPMQGAMIAASIANDGVMMEPYLVSSVQGPDQQTLYTAQPRVSNMAIDEATAREMRKLMNETVKHGTSARSFRGFFRKQLAELDVGGKTGSLTGFDPPGKYDWFIGFADAGDRKIAVAALTVHEKLWRVKSSYLARRAFESYFK